VSVQAAIDAAQVELLLQRGDRVGRGWVGPEGLVFRHPGPDGAERTVMVPIPLLVSALVRFNDLGPRADHPHVVRIALEAADLARALATGDAAATALEPGEPRDALAALLDDLQEHWSVTARWRPADGALGERTVEVLDTASGYWLVVPDHPTVELWPVTPSVVYRGLCRLVPGPREIAGGLRS
jgi:hypothetical protein